MRRLSFFLVAAALVVTSLPGHAAPSVRAFVAMPDGHTVTLTTPTLTYTSPVGATIQARIVCIKQQKISVVIGPPVPNVVTFNGTVTMVHAVKGSKHFYFGMGSIPRSSSVQYVFAARVRTTAGAFACKSPPFDGPAVGVAVFG